MIKSLQILRAIAALMVVLVHAESEVPLPTGSWFESVCSIGYAGVNLFFFISGFIMCYTTNSQCTPWKFIGRRFVRIIPLYWLLLLFHTGVHSLTNPQTYLSMLFIPLATTNPPFFGHATYIIGWTLNYEMFFYLIFFAAMFIGKHRNALIYTIMIALHLLFIVLLPTWNGLLQSFNPHTELPALKFAYLCMMVNPLILLFGVGMIVATIYKRFRGCPISYNIVVLIAAIAGIIGFFRYLGFDGYNIQTSFFCLMLFIGALSLERFISKSDWISKALQPLVYLGTISYSIYLLHLLFIYHLKIPKWEIPDWTKLPLIVILTLLASALSHELIEKRLSEKLKKTFKL